MKRLAWLLLAVFCTALGQVQRLEPVVPQKRACCECDGRCGMPGCALPVPHSPSAFVAEWAVVLARPASTRANRTVRKSVEKFYASVAIPGVQPVAWSAPIPLAPAASVPLFKVHCSFLI